MELNFAYKYIKWQIRQSHGGIAYNRFMGVLRIFKSQIQCFQNLDLSQKFGGNLIIAGNFRIFKHKYMENICTNVEKFDFYGLIKQHFLCSLAHKLLKRAFMLCKLSTFPEINKHTVTILQFQEIVINSRIFQFIWGNLFLRCGNTGKIWRAKCYISLLTGKLCTRCNFVKEIDAYTKTDRQTVTHTDTHTLIEKTWKWS